MPETKKYTVVDLFAGVGGLSYGFSRNDHFEIILANEMQKDIAKAYTINHPSVNMLQGDIKDLSENVLHQAIGNRTVDVVVGGPPCQSYSTLGKRQMDARANLFMEYKTVRLVLNINGKTTEVKYPVKGMMNSDILYGGGFSTCNITPRSEENRIEEFIANNDSQLEDNRRIPIKYIPEVYYGNKLIWKNPNFANT